MTEIRCISPIDGAVVAVRQSVDVAVATTMIEAARAAQTEWAARPLDERIALVNAGVAALGAANDDIVPELARMMGRPIRYGGEFGGVAERWPISRLARMPVSGGSYGACLMGLCLSLRHGTTPI
jgi:acyl-CoA reductase-like NAD-dependent aldehyde dehydrogenase